MTFTANIARKHAEAARNRAIELAKEQRCGISASINLCPVREVCENVAIWNAFCAEELAPIERREATLKRIARCRNARLLGRAARLFLVWGNPAGKAPNYQWRRLADAAHARRGALLERRAG